MNNPSAKAAHPESFFGWLDYDAKDAERMREVLAAFDEKDTVDSLGLGVIRDAIADALFPGISTIQTRARYFFIVPWICQYVESRSLGKRSVADDLRWYEGQTIQMLQQTCAANDGVIGWVAGRKLQRMPSSVYWNGLGQFRIRRNEGVALSQYLTVVGNGAHDLLRRHTNDDGELSGAARSFWDPDLPSAPTGFPGANPPVDLALTETESSYLADRFVTQAPGTLLSLLANDLSKDREVRFPWQVSQEGASDELQARLLHAQNFSEIMQGARILYNQLLVDASRDQNVASHDDLEAKASEMLEEWATLVSSRTVRLAAWASELHVFWDFVFRYGSPSIQAQDFVRNWVRLALKNPHGITGNAEARELIVARERALKRKLARLSNTRALEAFRGEMLDGDPLEYRWSNARIHLSDIQNYAVKTDAAA